MTEKKKLKRNRNMKVLKCLLSLNNIENMLRQASRISNRDKLKGWFGKNLLIPVLLVFAPYIFGLFIPSINVSFMEIMFNGGLTVIGVSVLYSTSSYLVRTKVNFEEQTSVASKKEKVFKALSSLREKVLDRTHFVVLASAIIYFIQIAYMSEKNSANISGIKEGFGTVDYILMSLVIGFLLFSVYFGKMIFELSDEFIDESKSFEAIYDLIEEQNKKTKDLMDDLISNGI